MAKIRNACCILLPGVHISHGRIDSLSTCELLLQEPLQGQERRAGQHILEMWQPALVERLDLELQQVPLLVGELGHPRVLVELDGFWLGRTKERRNAAIGLGLFRCVGCRVGCLALKTHGMYNWEE